MTEPTAFERAYKIIMERSEDPDRQYGDIDINFEKTAKMASIMTGKELTASDCYYVMICLKLARESNAHKQDNFVDALAYMGALANYKDKKHGV